MLTYIISVASDLVENVSNNNHPYRDNNLNATSEDEVKWYSERLSVLKLLSS